MFDYRLVLFSFPSLLSSAGRFPDSTGPACLVDGMRSPVQANGQANGLVYIVMHAHQENRDSAQHNLSKPIFLGVHIDMSGRASGLYGF